MSDQPTVVIQPTEKALRHRAELLASLKRVEAFLFLAGEAEKKGVAMRELVAQRVMSGEPLDVLQRQTDYDRGFVAGMRYITRDVIEGAERTAKKLEQAGADDKPEEKDIWVLPELPT